MDCEIYDKDFCATYCQNDTFDCILETILQLCATDIYGRLALDSRCTVSSISPPLMSQMVIKKECGRWEIFPEWLQCFQFFSSLCCFDTAGWNRGGHMDCSKSPPKILFRNK